MSKWKPYIATPEQMLADGYDPHELMLAYDVINGKSPMPKPEAMSDSLYALLYHMSREDVAANRAKLAENKRLRNAKPRRERNLSLRRAKATRLTPQQRKAVILLVAQLLSDPEAMAHVDDSEALLRHLDLKPKQS